MCGICGVLGRGDSVVAVSNMVAAMHHRGPDDGGVLARGDITLGMTRLAIIDTSSGGHQPMETLDGLISIVYNGELYNFRSERELLESKGHRFVSSSDTEVVLRMYEHYGDDFLLRMRGMFALAIHDRRSGPGREKLLLARDQMGIKPLLYARAGDRLIFASELKALLASGLLDPQIDEVSLRLLLTYGSVYQPHTMLRGVLALLPAHRMIVENGRERIERYWYLGTNQNKYLRELPYEEQVKEVGRALEESVRLQMISDVPLGAFLSGGIDSSLLVAMMARQVTGERVKTFSVGFEREGEVVDETSDAERTARFIGTDHSRVVVSGPEVRDRISHIAWGLDQPSVDGVNSYFVSLAARSAVTVAISGTGGDELFAGYPSFMKMKLETEENGHDSWMGSMRGKLSDLANQPSFDRLVSLRGGWRIARLREESFRNKYGSINTIFDTNGATDLIAPHLRRTAQAGRTRHYDLAHIDELPTAGVIERTSALCLRGYTSNQLLRDIDAVSMSRSLEVRVPYLDPVIADIAMSLPDHAKLGSLSDFSGFDEAIAGSYRATGAKRILLDIGKKFLPTDFDLKPKRGFGMPFGEWLRGPLVDVLEDTLSVDTTRQRGLLDSAAVTEVKTNFLCDSGPWYKSWLLMMLELWSREVLDRSSSLAGIYSTTQPNCAKTVTAAERT
jgi:asparagine synthase (glutamine-hydrolysing)